MMRNLVAALVLLALAGCASNTEKEGDYLSDAGITAEVKAMIFNETGIKALNVNVTTENRVVHLTGTVKSRAEMAKVVEAARRVERVRSVRNELKVQP
jgi:hyperosmotically inducible protein